LTEKFGSLSEEDVMSAALYPKVADDFFSFRETYGPVDKLSTRHFLVGPKIAEEFEVTIEQGKTLQFKTLACSSDLTVEGEREVFFELNGQLRSVFIKDNSAAKSMGLQPKADKSIAGHVGSPMKGDVIDVKVSVGDTVVKGQVVAVISAMKMEMAVQAGASGKVVRVGVAKGGSVLGNDLMMEIE
jgi:pyruvate carboxylase